MLLDPHFAVTFYPAPWPSTDDGLVLQSADHWAAGPGLAATHEQAVDRADYLRAAAPGFFPRGGRTTRLECEEVRAIADAADAMAAGLAAIEALPDTTGWVSIALSGVDRTWRISPAAVRSGGFTPDPVRGLLRLRWEVLGGPVEDDSET